MKINFTNSLVAVGFLALSVNLSAQQETQSSLYFFNPVMVNPAYAGSQDALQVTATVRDQWTGFKGAPKTQCLSLHTPLRREKIGIGFTVLNDAIGATKNTGFYGDFSYSIRLNQKNSRLAFGLKAGVDIYKTNFQPLRVNDNTDAVYTNGFNYTKTLFNTGAGIYYYGKRHYLGIASPRLIPNKINLTADQTALQENHFYGFGGVVIKLNGALNLRPSFMVKYVKNAPLSMEGNLSLLIYDKVWVGAMYRHGAAAGANIMFNLTQNLRVGYAYDYALTKIQNYSAGSHEIMLSYNLRSKSNGLKSPRYF